MTDIIIRQESPADFEEITIINNLAFNQTQEGRLIENLRKRPEFVPELSLVAISNNEIVGHILFFPVSIISGNNRIITLSLAPMSVKPIYQRKGTGSTLVRAGLEKAKELGYKSVVVLGHAEYYPRFGFRKACEWQIKEPFGVPDDIIMALELVMGGLGSEGGMIDFPKEYFAAI